MIQDPSEYTWETKMDDRNPVSARIEINGLTGTFMDNEFDRLSRAINRYIKRHTPKGTRLSGCIGTSASTLVLTYRQEDDPK